MKEWEIRSNEEANLFNPPFLSLLVHETIRGYQKESGNPLPFGLSFLAVSLILHKKTRESFPRSIATLFPAWITRPEGTRAKLGFPTRSRSMVPYVKEGVLFGLTQNLFILESGNLNISESPQISKPDAFGATPDHIACSNSAFFCGRWFALSGTVETIFALLGVRP